MTYFSELKISVSSRRVKSVTSKGLDLSSPTSWTPTTSNTSGVGTESWDSSRTSKSRSSPERRSPTTKKLRVRLTEPPRPKMAQRMELWKRIWKQIIEKYVRFESLQTANRHSKALRPWSDFIAVLSLNAYHCLGNKVGILKFILKCFKYGSKFSFFPQCILKRW